MFMLEVTNLFCIDTSAFVRIFRFYPQGLVKQIWDNLKNLFYEEKMISHILVYEEITTSSKKQDFLSQCVTPLRSFFKGMNFNQVVMVSKIVKKFPGLIEPNKERDEADPWLIALAIEQKKQLDLFNPSKELYLVSEESERKPSKIPAVCKHYGINHINLEGFYKMQGWTFKVL